MFRSRSRRLGSAALAAFLALGAATACDPPAPTPTFVVTTTADGVDAAPGDGTCEMTPGAGDCSLRAAVDEGNALGTAAITLPAGTYGGLGFQVTGNLSINRDAPVDARLGSKWITVAAGGHLHVDGLSSYDVPGVRFTVEGTFVGRHLSLVGLESSSQVIVRPSGVAVVENSLLAHVFGATPSVRNEGVLILQHTALLAWSAVGVPTTAFVNTGSAHVAASVLQSCGGSTAPLSLGYNSDSDGTCALAAPGDQPAAPPLFAINLTQPVTYDLDATSPLVDAIPPGVNGCGTTVTDDLSGSPRPTDGNGDGTPGCDIGARERPAP